MTFYKSIDQAGITDDLMFSWVMEQEENCLKLVQAVLPELGITSIEFETQKRLAFSHTSKASIPDILAYDKQGRVYDLEMQLTRKDDLGKRMRYYQSMIDQEILSKGESYKNLRKSYIIVFFPMDPFEENLRRYTFTHQCLETENAQLHSESNIILLNSKGTKGKISARLERFFELMNGKINVKDKYIQTLQKDIDKFRQDPRRRKQYMDYQLNLQDARYEGIKFALKRTIKMLKKMGLSSKQASENVLDQYKDQLPEEEIRESIRKVYKE